MKKMLLHYFGAAIDDTDHQAALIIGKIKKYQQKKVLNFYDFNSLLDSLKILIGNDDKATVFVWDLKIFFSFIEDDYFANNFVGIGFDEVRNGDTGEVYGGKLKANDKVFNFIDLSKIYPVNFKELGAMFGIKIEMLDWLLVRNDSSDLAPWEWQAFNNQFLLVEKLVNLLLTNNKYKKIRMTRSTMVFNRLKEQILNDDKRLQRHYYQAIFGTNKNPIFNKKQRTLYNTLRHAYYGGFNYLKKEVIGCELGAGIDLDINSLYPYVMSNFNFPVQSSMKRLPKAKFKRLKSEDLINNNFFSIFHLAIYDIKLKPNHYPTIPQKSNFIQNKRINRLDEINGGEIYVSNFDFYYLLKNYNIKYEYVDGVMWTKMLKQPFKSFVDKNIKIKNEATLKHQKITRLLAKLNLNMCYGKFGQSPLFQTGVPFFNEDEQITEFEGKLTDSGYLRNITLAIFITSIARHVLFSNIDKIINCSHCQFIYSDTDSIHFLIDDEFQKLTTAQICERLGIEFDKVKLGAFKEERRFKAAKFLRNKGYVEILEDGKIEVVISGLNDGACKVVAQQIKRHGLSYLTLDEPLLVPMWQVMRVPGGSLIRNHLVTINKSDISLKQQLL